jgi:hypothetical protein
MGSRMQEARFEAEAAKLVGNSHGGNPAIAERLQLPVEYRKLACRRHKSLLTR